MARRLRREDYTVGWVCALPTELAAAQEMLDEEHADLGRDLGDNDQNLYTLGSIGGHNVAIVCLPAGRIGNNPAAVVAMQMRATFKEIRFGLMVGIGGGVPSAKVDIRLGDVVVSQPNQIFAGVVQYDAGKSTLSGFSRTGSLNSPPEILLAAVTKICTSEMRGKSRLLEHVSKLERIPQFQRITAGRDVLFKADYEHETGDGHDGGQACENCSADREEARQPRRKEKKVVVHYGTIASGNQVIKNAYTRDKLSRELGGVLCFEMEAASLMNSFPSLVIRGICDYADSHKNKQWQPYAAGTAAAYAKEVLSVIPPAEVAETYTVEEAMREGPQKKLLGLPVQRATAPPLNVRSTRLNQYKGNGPQLRCQTCDKKFESKEAVKDHMAAVGHRSPSISCKTCAKKFESKEAVDRHMATNGNGSPSIPCKTCAQKFHTQEAVNQHMTAVGHRSPNLSCKKCVKKFHTQSAANEHMAAVGH